MASTPSTLNIWLTGRLNTGAEEEEEGQEEPRLEKEEEEAEETRCSSRNLRFQGRGRHRAARRSKHRGEEARASTTLKRRNSQELGEETKSRRGTAELGVLYLRSLGVCGGFMPSTRVVSRNDGSGWSHFRF